MFASLKVIFRNRLLRIAVAGVLVLFLGVAGLRHVNNLFASDLTACKVPPFLTSAVAPMVMMVVSKDHTNYAPAYSDNQKLKPGNDTIQKTYDNSIDYYGYFDSSKCYTYGSMYFSPSGNATNHLCPSSSAWSGNFLNWASMTRMDALRKVLYGGYRETGGSGDTATSTILQRAYIPAEGHAWVKVYNGNDGRPAISSLTPYTPSDGNLTLMNVSCNTYMNRCVADGLTDMPIIRVANGNFYDWDLAETCVGYFRAETGACNSGDNDIARRNPPQAQRLADLAVRVKACVPGQIRNEMCKEYSPGSGNSKPYGLLQKYGDKGAMHFGLITGSYVKNTSGGLLRKRIRNFANEVNATTGVFTSTQGIVNTLSKLRLIDYPSGSGGYYFGCGFGVPMTEGSQGCRNWGNPVGEMLYEALRYYAGANGPTSVFDTSDSALAWTGGTLSISKDSWNDPYAQDGCATYNHAYCSKPYILVVSDIYPSYDDNQLPGSAFSTFAGDSTYLPGMNVTSLAKTITQNEPNATNPEVPGRYFIGNIAGNATNANTCSDKNVASLGAIKGFCPGYAGVNGTYYSPAVAYYGKKNDLRSSASAKPITGKPATVKISPTTLAVALADPLPVIEIKTSNGKLSISPIMESRWSGNPSYVSMGSYLKAKYKTPAAGYDGEIEITWENTYQASDYDLDLAHRIRWKVDTVDTTKVIVENAMWSKKAGAQMKAGYAASGSTTLDGRYMDLLADYGNNYVYPQFPPNDWTCPVAGTDCVRCPNASYCTFSRRTFTTKSTATAKSMYLKNPLFYAAKWGGFTDLNTNNIPDDPNEWNKNRYSDPTLTGVPDNYFFVENPNQLFQSLDKAFSAVLLREGTAGAVATVTQEVHQGDIVVRAAFESFDPTNPNKFTWFGHLESYQPYSGCSGLTSGSSCNSTSGCTWNGSTCNGTIYSFQLAVNQGKFCHDILPATSAHCLDGGYVLSTQQTYDNRTIFTVSGTDTKTDFVTGVNNATLKVHKDFDGIGGAGTAADVTLLKDWVRGSNATAVNLRNRQGWKLGDIVYSTPVTVGPPSVSAVPRFLADVDFRTFLTNQAHRDQMVYVGANDGMLHAFNLGFWDNSTIPNQYVYDQSFNSATGKERWAYIPSNLLSELQCLAISTYGTSGTNACSHRFTVDLSPVSWDMKINNGGLKWTSILLGGERGGGDTYFALAVTNPDEGNVTPLWEYSVLKNYPVPAGANATLLSTTYYDAMKTLPLSWSLPYAGRLHDSANGTPVAFIGGGIRDFQPDTTSITSSIKLNQVGGTFWRYLYYPTFHAIKLELGNGTDVWKDDWTNLLQTGTFQTAFPVNTSGTPVLPYAVANVAVFDLFDSNGRSVTNGGHQDGFTDLLYAGDLNGTFYTMVMNSAGATPSRTPSCIVGRKVQPANISTQNGTDSPANTNPFRGTRQPITVTPVAALDTDQNLRVYFGTGKFDDVPDSGGTSDKSDNATMSFYCLVENLNSPLGNATSARCTGNGTVVATSPFNFSYMKCLDEANGARKFKWVNVAADNSTSPDGGSCFQCIFDLLNRGERVIDSALVAGGYVFFTTFTPSYTDPCAVGDARLYVLDYMCKPLKDPSQIIQQGGTGTQYYNLKGNSWSSGATNFVGAIQVNLGSGMPSRPVLDSSGTSLFIQTSDARLLRIQVDLGAGGRSKVQGWTRED